MTSLIGRETLLVQPYIVFAFIFFNIAHVCLQESDFGGGGGGGGEGGGDAAAEDSDYAVNRKSRKSSSRKSSSHNTPTTQSQEPTTGMPTIEEVCNTFGLTDVQIEYSDADFQNLTTYKLFQQHVRPLLAKENPKVRTSLACDTISTVIEFFS